VTVGIQNNLENLVKKYSHAKELCQKNWSFRKFSTLLYLYIGEIDIIKIVGFVSQRSQP
jgi:hypothetical protein